MSAYDQRETLVIVALGIAVTWMLSQSPEGATRQKKMDALELERQRIRAEKEYQERLERFRESAGDYSAVLTPVQALSKASLEEHQTDYTDTHALMGHLEHAIGAFDHHARQVQRETEATLRGAERASRQLDPGDFTTQPVTRESLKAETEALFSILDESDVTYLKDGDALPLDA